MQKRKERSACCYDNECIVLVVAACSQQIPSCSIYLSNSNRRSALNNYLFVFSLLFPTTSSKRDMSSTYNTYLELKISSTISLNSSTLLSPGYNFPPISHVGYPGTSFSLQKSRLLLNPSRSHSIYGIVCIASYPKACF